MNYKIAEKMGLKELEWMGSQQNVGGIDGGEGVIGTLSEAMAADDFVLMLKKVFGVECVMANELIRRKIRLSGERPMVPYIAAAATIYLVILHEMSYNIVVQL